MTESSVSTAPVNRNSMKNQGCSMGKGKEWWTLGAVSTLSIVVFVVVLSLAPSLLRAQGTADSGFSTRALGSVAAIGDSITKAYNAEYSAFGSCRYTDNPQYSFSTNTSGNTTISIVERAMAYKGSEVATANFGFDGARMSSGLEQAQAVKAWIVGQAAPRLITVFLGHNDICGGEKDKYHVSCSRTYQDPDNYCRTRAWDYEKQMREMLDVLITIPSSQIAMIHPLRVSQLCNFAKEKVVDEWFLTRRCEDLWKTPSLIGQDAVCPSLTSCSADRVADAYTTWVSYRDIGNKVVDEYNLYAAGQTIPYDSTYSTGNVVRANDVSLRKTDVLGNVRFNYRDAFGNAQLSVCECFHPSKYGQNLLASLLWDGVACSTTTPCCNDSVEGDSDYNKGLCSNYTTSGSMNGLWFAAIEGYFDTVQRVYIGYYQRPADPGGLLYWADRLTKTSGNLNEIIDAYATSQESHDLYGTINVSTIGNVIDGIYTALFNRTADEGGRQYYTAAYTAGHFPDGRQCTEGTIVLDILGGAQNQDAVSINNKLTAANLFTRVIDPELDGANFQVTYAGEGDALKGRTFLASVTDNPGTVPSQSTTAAFMKSNIADPGDPIWNP